MADIGTPTEEQIAEWNAWVAERPDAVRKVAERFKPWRLYRLARSETAGHRVTLVSFSEGDGGAVTVTVNVTGEFNRVAFERQVFGVNPDDLVECELPAENEQLGSLDLDPEMFRANIVHGEPLALGPNGGIITGCMKE